jgi:hypothetical protein
MEVNCKSHRQGIQYSGCRHPEGIIFWIGFRSPVIMTFMKRELVGLFFVFALLVACDDSDNQAKKNENATLSNVQKTVVDGQWRIGYFFDSGTDETGNFHGYIFDFDANNTLTATNGSNNYPGGWSAVDDSTGDDNPDSELSDIDFVISFTNPPDFQELSEDWEIISISAAKIELRHVSGGDGGVDLLTLEKI